MYVTVVENRGLCRINGRLTVLRVEMSTTSQRRTPVGIVGA